MCFGTFTFICAVGGFKKKVIRLITGIKKYESCRQKLKESRIVTVNSVYGLEV